METKQTFTPGPDLMVVKKTDGPRKPGIIVVPDTAKSKESWVMVVATSVCCARDLKPGDIVLIADDTRGVPFKLNGEDVFMMREEHALGVMREEPAQDGVDEPSSTSGQAVH